MVKQNHFSLPRSTFFQKQQAPFNAQSKCSATCFTDNELLEEGTSVSDISPHRHQVFSPSKSQASSQVGVAWETVLSEIQDDQYTT